MRAVIFRDKTIISSLIWRAIKWHLNYIITKNPMPLACGLYITNRCNFRCNFCNIWRKENPQTLSLLDAKKIIDNLSSLGCFYFSITGGEPLTVEHIFELLAYTKKSKIKYIHLVTNGYLLDAEKAIRFNKTGINEISISIDGREEFHDNNRGVRGAYKNAIRAIENLKMHAPKVRIVLNTILKPDAHQESLHAVELARRFNVGLKVQPLNQHPVFNKNNYSSISPKEIFSSEIKETITSLCKEDSVVNSRKFLSNIYNFLFQKERLVLRNSPCLFGYHHIEILEDGRVFPCLEGMGWQGGFLDYKALKDLFHSFEYKKLLRNLKKCQGCLRNYYICYYESRITFPINNFLKSMV